MVSNAEAPSRWSRDGGTVVFLRAKLTAVPVSLKPTFSYGQRPLFEAPISPNCTNDSQWWQVGLTANAVLLPSAKEQRNST